MRKRTLRDLSEADLAGKRVLLRVDFNVPMDGDRVMDDARIAAAIPTIQYLLRVGASVICCSHLGRPGGQPDARYDLTPAASRLARLLKQSVQMAPDCIGAIPREMAGQLQPGQVLVLQNLRFHEGEEANDPGFADQLASLADVYVNDAFGASHRAHASTVALAERLPAAAGSLLQKEIDIFQPIVDGKAGKLGIISGGAKISDKIDLLKRLASTAGVLCIGGAMANTFLHAQGTPIENSLAETDLASDARAILALAKKKRCKVLLPSDCIIARGADHPPQARPFIFAEETMPEETQILDVGPSTIEQFSAAVEECDTIVWNGPLGLAEREAFAGGTKAMAIALGKLESQDKARVIVCGGDTAAAIARMPAARKLTHISTGGGAALEFLEGRPLPGIAALPDVRDR